MAVFGIDPGETTGIVEGVWTSGRFEFSASVRHFHSVAEDFQFWVDVLAEADSVFCETFQLRTAVTSSSVLSPVVVRTIVQCAVSSLGLACSVGGWSASVTKTRFTDDRLRRAGYWIAGKDHKRDALRQVLVSHLVEKRKR